MTEHEKDKEMIAKMNSLAASAEGTVKYLELNKPYMNGPTARELTVSLHHMLAHINQMLALCEEVKLHRDRQAEAAAKAAARLPKRPS